MDNYIKLSSLKIGESGIIDSLENRGMMRRRLIDLGFAKGSEAACVGVAPLGDPKAYLIKGTVIALREEDSSKINVEKCK